MEKKKVAIIGAGISGITAGVMLLQEGYDVLMYDKNDNIGGLVSGYYVNGHYIDACLHWLVGTKPGSTINRRWVNNGMLGDDIKLVGLETLGTFEYKGKSVTFYRDLDKGEAEWINDFPEDEKNIKKFFNAVRSFSKTLDLMDQLGTYNNILKTFFAILKIVYGSSAIFKTRKLSREDFAKKYFKSEALRFAFKNVQNGFNNMLFFIYVYASFYNGDVDVPVGGALPMMKRAEERFTSLGGKLFLNTPVTEITYENKHVTGIIANDEFVKVDAVISTVDPFYTHRVLLNDKFKDKKLFKMLKKEDEHPIVSCFDVYFTIDADLTNLDVPVGLNVNPIKVGKRETDFLMFRSYHFDPDYFIKDGKTVVSVLIDQASSDYKFWNDLHEEAKELYDRENRRIIKDISNALEERYPEFKGKIEYLTHFGPLDIKDRNNNTFGALQSFSYSEKDGLFFHNFKVKKLKGLFLASQWSKSVGGTPIAATNGSGVVSLVKMYLKN